MQTGWKAATIFLWKHWIITAALAVTIAYFMTPHTLERLFVYFPTKQLEGDPSSIGLAFQDLRIVTEDHVTLHGWFVPHPDAKRTLLIFHGNAGNISHQAAMDRNPSWTAGARHDHRLPRIWQERGQPV